MDTPRHSDPAPRSSPPPRTYDPPPTRTYDPPTRGYTPPRNDPPPRARPDPVPPPSREQPRYDPPRRSQPTLPSDPPGRNDGGSRRYEPRDTLPRDTPRDTMPPRQVPDAGDRARDNRWPDDRSGPVRIVVPGDRSSDDRAAPPVRTRINTGLQPNPGAKDGSRDGSKDGDGAGNTRSSLRDLYERAARGGDAKTPVPPGGSELGSAGMRSSLSSRYQRKLDSDLDRASRKVDADTPPPVADRNAGKDDRSDRADRVGDRRADGGSTDRDRAADRAGDRARDVGARGKDLGRDDRSGSDLADRTGGRTDKRAAPPERKGPAGPIDTVAGHRYAPVNPPPARHDVPRVVSGPPIQRAPPLTVGRSAPVLSGSRLVSQAFRSRHPASFFCGTSNWGAHHSAIWFSFGWSSRSCRWGLYSFPFWHGCHWPRWHWGCRSWFSFGLRGWSRWGGLDYGLGFNFGRWGSCWPGWYSPSWCSTSYYPASYYGNASWDQCDWWWDPNWPAYGSSYVVVREVVRDSGEETVSTSDTPKPTTRSLAEKHVRLGDFYFGEGRYKEASESYLRALTYAPDDAAVHFVLADSLFAMGDYHYAAFIIGRALDHDPSFARVDADKRKFYLDKSLFDAQLKTLRNYLAEKPYDAAATLVLGYNLRFSADPEGAKTAFRRVLEIDPHSEPAKLFLTALEPPKAETKPESAPDSKPASEPATRKDE